MLYVKEETLVEGVTIMKSEKGSSTFAVAYNEQFRVMRDVTTTLNAMFKDGIGAKGRTNDNNALIEIKKFLSFLKGTSIRLVNDDKLTKYRDQRLVEIQEGKRSKGDNNISQDSVNVYLKYVYQFMAKYYELYGDRTPLLMGCTDKHRVKTGMFDSNNTRLSKTKRKETTFYPLLFSTPTRSPTNLKITDIPTEADYIELITHIADTESTPFIRERNKLIIMLSRCSSMRRISIASLNASQFEDIGPAEEEGSMPVTPSKQKFSYSKSVEIDYTLALDIKNYIDLYLKPHLEKIGKSLSWCGALFVNETDGKRMRREYISQTVGRYCTELDWPKGKRLHAFRHLFASEEYEREYARQLKLQPKNPQAAERATKIHLKGRLSQNSLEAQSTYLTVLNLKSSNERKKKQHEIEKLKSYQRANEQKRLKKLERIIEENNINLEIDF